jgi:hypothetical protein
MRNWKLSSYWRAARAARYSLSFAFPLLILYELLASSLSQGEVAAVRNGADVLLKSLFLTLGGRDGLTAFGALVIGGGAGLIVQDLRRSGGLEPRFFVWMATESVGYALMFGLVAGTLTGLLLPGIALFDGVRTLMISSLSEQGLLPQLMISLGAGIYEELVFRVILVSGLVLLGRKVFGWSPTGTGFFSVILGALIFSAFHYMGPYGDPLELGSFSFRTIAGLLFSGLYLLRGFGITAWTHALYDVFLAFRW